MKITCKALAENKASSQKYYDKKNAGSWCCEILYVFRIYALDSKGTYMVTEAIPRLQCTALSGILRLIRLTERNATPMIRAFVLWSYGRKDRRVVYLVVQNRQIEQKTFISWVPGSRSPKSCAHGPRAVIKQKQGRNDSSCWNHWGRDSRIVHPKSPNDRVWQFAKSPPRSHRLLRQELSEGFSYCRILPWWHSDCNSMNSCRIGRRLERARRSRSDSTTFDSESSAQYLGMWMTAI